jgi:hypothetical protein
VNARFKQSDVPRPTPQEALLPKAKLNLFQLPGVENVVSEIGPELHSEKEAEECVDACAICLCWHLAALREVSRRMELAQELMSATPEQISSYIAVFSAVEMAEQKNIDYAQACQELEIEVVCAQEADTAKIYERAEAKTSQRRKLPPLIMPHWTRRRCGELVRRLIGAMAADLRPDKISAVSDAEIELRVREYHSAMCYFLGPLNDPKRQHLAAGWWSHIPMFVNLTIAVGVAEEQKIPVGDALNSLTDEPMGFEFDGRRVVTWQNADGAVGASGPKGLPREKLWDLVHLDRAMTEAVGSYLNLVPINVLNEILSRHHTELARLVADDEREFWPISQEEFDAGVQSCLNMMEPDPHDLMFLHISKAVAEAMEEEITVH